VGQYIINNLEDLSKIKLTSLKIDLYFNSYNIFLENDLYTKFYFFICDKNLEAINTLTLKSSIFKDYDWCKKYLRYGNSLEIPAMNNKNKDKLILKILSDIIKTIKLKEFI
jgi:hypothetical protein